MCGFFAYQDELHEVRGDDGIGDGDDADGALAGFVAGVDGKTFRFVAKAAVEWERRRPRQQRLAPGSDRRCHFDPPQREPSAVVLEAAAMMHGNHWRDFDLAAGFERPELLLAFGLLPWLVSVLQAVG